MRGSHVVVFAVVAPLALGACGSGGSSPGSAPVQPAPAATPSSTPGAGATVFNAANFPATPRVDNPWFPLLPGSVWKYIGVKDGETSTDTVTVRASSKIVNGVHAVDVADMLYIAGVLEERTNDWYAQDNAGNVWYLGEDTAELDPHGKVTSTEGSWEAGKQ